MQNILIGYQLEQDLFCLDRPFNKVSYSMIRISGQSRSVNRLNELISANEVFNISLLNSLNLYFRII